MNTLKITICGFSLLVSLSLAAQEKSFPENIPYQTRFEVSVETLEKLFHTSGHFSINFSPAFSLAGTVQSRTEKNATVSTLLIQTENMHGEVLSLSRSVSADGLVQYTGHLMKLHEPDGMLLAEKDNHYYFIRTEQRYLVAE